MPASNMDSTMQMSTSATGSHMALSHLQRSRYKHPPLPVQHRQQGRRKQFRPRLHYPAARTLQATEHMAVEVPQQTWQWVLAWCLWSLWVGRMSLSSRMTFHQLSRHTSLPATLRRPGRVICTITPMSHHISTPVERPNLVQTPPPAPSANPLCF